MSHASSPLLAEEARTAHVVERRLAVAHLSGPQTIEPPICRFDLIARRSGRSQLLDPTLLPRDLLDQSGARLVICQEIVIVVVGTLDHDVVVTIVTNRVDNIVRFVVCLWFVSHTSH